MKNRKRRGILASIGAVAAGSVLALTGTVAANAATPNNAVPETTNVVITKCEQPTELGEVADGAQNTTLDCEGINEVKFQAYPVTIEDDDGPLSAGSNAWQQAVGTLKVEDETVKGAGYTVTVAEDPTTGMTGTTSTQGVLQWVDVPTGVYLVKETKTPPGVTASPDFLLTVPMTDPADGSKWLDTVYVYPKNSLVEVTKEADTEGVNVVGDVVTWTIDANIPRVANPKYGEADEPAFIAPDAYQIWDTLKDDQLTLHPEYSDKGSNVAIKVTIQGTGTGFPELLTEGTKGEDEDTDTGDYYIEQDTSVSGMSTYKIVFTNAGLAKLATAVNTDPEAKVQVTLHTKIEGTDGGKILNAADLYPNQESITDENPAETPPSNDNSLLFGGIKVKKVDSNTSGTKLEGAKFRVYATKTAAEDAVDLPFGDGDTGTSTDGYLVPATDGTANNGTYASGTWTTDTDGVVVIDGLLYNHEANGGAAESRTYWLVEVEAPDGYQLLTEPVPFEVKGSYNDGAAEYTVLNVKSNQGGFVLPLTGGMGTWLLTIGGLLLLAVVLTVARRRRSMEAAE